MLGRILRCFVMFALIALTACNLPQGSASTPSDQSVPQPGLSSQPSPIETELDKAYLPVINSESEAAEGIQVDPHVEVLASQTELKVGDILTITGKPVELGLPYYYLIIRDEGIQQVEPIVQVTYDNQVKPMSGTSQVLELISATGQMDLATFQLKAVAAGQSTITISATGEVNVGSSGSSMWSAGGSGDVLIKVQP